MPNGDREIVPSSVTAQTGSSGSSATCPGEQYVHPRLAEIPATPRTHKADLVQTHHRGDIFQVSLQYPPAMDSYRL